MSVTRPTYRYVLDGRRFAIRPVSDGSYVLSIDGQLGGFYRDAEDAAEDCRGHVSMVIAAERPHSVLRDREFPGTLSEWERAPNAGSEADEWRSR
jgi:hypothetical protein